jgi:hypothetical protein
MWAACASLLVSVGVIILRYFDYLSKTLIAIFLLQAKI